MKIWEINTGEQVVNDLLCSFGDSPKDGLFSLDMAIFEVAEHDPSQLSMLKRDPNLIAFRGDGEVLS